MSLFKAETRRLLKRRFVRYMTLLGLFVLAAVVVGTFVTNQKVGPPQIAAAERAAEREYQQNVEFSNQFRQECERAKAAGDQSKDGQFPTDCAQIQPPPREAFQAQWYLPATFDFRKEFGGTITTFGAILALIAFVVGASFVGAEWNTGGMTNLLLWRPQRLKVLLTKLGALLVGLVTVTVVSAAAWVAAFWVIGSYRGTTEKMTPGVWQSFALTGLRGLTLVLLAGLVGFALASLGRHTALALGGALGAVVVGQFGLGVLLSMAQVRFMQAWLLPTYMLAWMQKKITLEDWNACQYSYTGECKPKTMEITWHDSAVLFSVGAVLALGLAMWAMRRRDVT